MKHKKFTIKTVEKFNFGSKSLVKSNFSTGTGTDPTATLNTVTFTRI